MSATAVVPTLTAARRLRLRRRAWASVWAAALPTALHATAYGYQALVGRTEANAEAATNTLAYMLAAVTVLSGLAGARTLYVLRTRHNLDAHLRSYAWGRRCSIVAIASAVVWGVVGLAVAAFHAAER